MNIAVISTSPRKGSNSLKVAKYLTAQLKEKPGIKVSLVNFEKADIPMVGRGELNPEKLSEFQARLVSEWQKADLVIFVVPEYNWITGGELINAFHQLGKKEFLDLFDHKAFAFAGVSNGRGGRRPCLEMTTLVNKLISFLNGNSVVSPRIMESHQTQDNLDEKGSLTGGDFYEKLVADFLDYNLKVATRWKNGVVAEVQ